MKRYVLKLILLVLCLNGFTQEKDFNLNFLQEINVSRKKMNISSMNVDSSLVYALNEINKRTYLMEEDEDSIRAILSSFNNHDYQIKLLKIGLEKKKSIDLVELLKNNKDLSQIVSDSCYNMIGYIKVEEASNDYLLVLATQNYIRFEDRLLFEDYFVVEGEATNTSIPVRNRYITLKGKTNIDSIMFFPHNIRSLLPSHKKSECSNVVTNNDGQFSIKVDGTKFKKNGFNYIFFCDKSGKIIATFKINQP
jgi:hypothetical protein